MKVVKIIIGFFAKAIPGMVESLCNHDFVELADSGGDPPSRYYQCKKCDQSYIDRPRSNKRKR